MIIKELISELQKCNQDMEIQVFDEKSRPYRVKKVIVHPEFDGEFSNIEIEPIELY